MKSQLSRIDLVNEYERAPDSAYFSQETIAAIRDCSIATVERDRWAGTGIKFVKMGHLVRYKKSEIKAWLDQHEPVNSTSVSKLVRK